MNVSGVKSAELEPRVDPSELIVYMPMEGRGSFYLLLFSREIEEFNNNRHGKTAQNQ